MMRQVWFVVSLAACGSTTTSAPPATPVRDVRASEHRDAARLHAARAAELQRISDALGQQPIEWKNEPRSGMWFRALAEERQADLHLEAAAALEAEFHDRCAGLTQDQISLSPLQRFATGGSPKGDGMIVFLTPEAGPADRLLHELRCHQAWMKLGEAQKDECPLELRGLDLVAYGDASGISVELAVQDPALVAELQRRTRTVIETGQHARAPGS